MKTILEVRHELGISTNLILNSFIKTFDLKIFNTIYINDPKKFNWSYRELRDYHPISDNLYNLLYSMRAEIVAYSRDYYKWKSIHEIAEKIKKDPIAIINYLNNNAPIFYKSSQGNYAPNLNVMIYNKDIRKLENNNITLETEIKHFSSFEILKGINLIEQFNTLIIK